MMNRGDKNYRIKLLFKIVCFKAATNKLKGLLQNTGLNPTRKKFAFKKLWRTAVQTVLHSFLFAFIFGIAILQQALPLSYLREVSNLSITSLGNVVFYTRQDRQAKKRQNLLSFPFSPSKHCPPWTAAAVYGGTGQNLRAEGALCWDG